VSGRYCGEFSVGLGVCIRLGGGGRLGSVLVDIWQTVRMGTVNPRNNQNKSTNCSPGYCCTCMTGLNILLILPV